MRSRPRGERVHPVAGRRQGDEEETQNRYLKRDGAGVRIHELRQEREEEERRLRVEHVDDDPLAEEPPEGARDARLPPLQPLARKEPSRTQVDEIGGTRVLHDREGQRRLDDERREPERRRHDVNQGSDLDSEHGDEARHTPLLDAPRDDVEHGGAGYDEQHESRTGKEEEGRWLGQELSLPHEPLTRRRHERHRFREEDPHCIAERDRLLVNRPLGLDLLQGRPRQFDSRVQRQGGELLPLRLLHRLGLLLRELAQAAHEILRVAAEGKAETTFHLRPFVASAVIYAPMPTSRFAEALNEQVAYEFAASQQYVAIAVYYDRETLAQLASHFYRQAVEERNHAMMIVQYLLDADLPVRTPAVAAPQTDFSDAVAPVQLALDQEKRVTEQISQLAALAREEGELVGAQFLDWFLKEQREEVASMSDLRAIVERASASNLLLAEDYLARVQIGDQGADPSAPEAAGGAL